MLSTARAASSPGCGHRPLSDAPRRALVFVPGGGGRLAAAGSGVHGPRPHSLVARAAGSSNPAGCLEAAVPWSGIRRPAPPIVDDAPLSSPPAVSSEERVRQLVLKQAALAAAAAARPPRTSRLAGRGDAGALDAAFDRCGAVCKEYAKTFYLADDAGEEAGDLGHLRMVQEDGRAGGRPERGAHLRAGAGPVGVAPRGRLRRPALRHARRGAGRRRGRVPGRGRAAVPGHDRGDAHGPRPVPLRHLRRPLPVLLPRGRHRRAHDRPHHGRLPGLRSRARDGVCRRARARRRQPAHQHPQRRRGGCEEGQDISSAGRARHSWHLRGRHLRRPRHERMEELHERPDREGEVLLPAGRAGRRRAQPGEPMAGLGISASIPADPGRDRGQRLRQLHQESLRSQGQEAGGAAQGLPQITEEASFFAEPSSLNSFRERSLGRPVWYN